MTLPLSVKQIVGSKYLFCFTVLPVSLIGTIVIYLSRWIVYHAFSADLFRISIMFAVILPLLWCSLCLALAQWIGYMNIQYCPNSGYVTCPLHAARFKKHRSCNLDIRSSSPHNHNHSAFRNRYSFVHSLCHRICKKKITTSKSR